MDSNNIEGKIPQEVCALHTGGLLAQISADCKADNTFKVRCSCCFNCPASQSQPASCPKYSVATYFGVEEVEENVRAKEIETKCLELSGDKICQHNTPQNLAMKWMIFDDRLRLDITSLDFIQRYAMTVIYFSLGPDAWIDSFWLSPREDECQITGVKCDKEMRITSLNFSESQFIFAISPLLFLLYFYSILSCYLCQLNQLIPVWRGFFRQRYPSYLS